MTDGEAADVLCDEEAEQPEQPEETILPEPAEQPTEQPTEPEPPKPKAKAKPKGRPPPKAGEETPLRPRLKDKTTCKDCNKQISLHAMHYTHSKVCKGKATSNIVLEDIKVEEPKEPKTKTIKPITTSIETNPVEVVKELRTVDLSENEMKEVLLKYAKTVKDKQKQEKQKKYKSLLDGKLKSN